MSGPKIPGADGDCLASCDADALEEEFPRIAPLPKSPEPCNHSVQSWSLMTARRGFCEDCKSKIERRSDGRWYPVR